MALGNGQLFTVGTATSPGDLSKDHSAAKIVGIASTPTGHGYLLVGADGGIFCFGTAPYLVGSGNVQKGSIPPLQNIITAPIVGAAG